MKTVVVVGAGFAGLTLSYYLRREGFRVIVNERRERSGGMLGTQSGEFGLIETAANALISNRAIEAMFDDLGLEFAERLTTRRNRYIFDGEAPSRWPLEWRETARLSLSAAGLYLGLKKMRPAARESIAEWGDRFGGENFTDRILAPGLQGVYAGDPKRLSAVLILKNVLAKTNRAGRFKGRVSPQGGMGQLVRALTKHLAKDGVRFNYDENYQIPKYITTPLVLATPAWVAAELTKTARPAVAERLKTCESLALVTQTAFYKSTPEDLEGFGCLFPKADKFNHLGVIFNSCVFGDRARSGYRSETWIAGGYARPDVIARSDQDLRNELSADRARLVGRAETPVETVIIRWPRAIPHYTVEWERTLDHLDVAPPLYLHGNYLGQLGLAGVHTRSRQLARLIRTNHG